MSVWVFIATCLAGGLGAVLRWMIDAAMTPRVPTRFPVAIFSVNIVGSFALGLVVSGVGTGPIASVVGVGLLGGFTTFSTVAVASAVLVQKKAHLIAVVNVVATFVACVGAAVAGLALGASLTV